MLPSVLKEIAPTSSVLTTDIITSPAVAAGGTLSSKNPLKDELSNVNPVSLFIVIRDGVKKDPATTLVD